MMTKDYSEVRDPYKVLEIPTTATEEEIKKVYRVLALKYHPDKISKDPLSQSLAEKYFREIAEAYDILKNDRAEYDRQRLRTSSEILAEPTAEEIKAEREAQEEYDRKEAERKAEREKATTPPPFTSGTSSRSAYTSSPHSSTWRTASRTSTYTPPLRKSRKKYLGLWFFAIPILFFVLISWAGTYHGSMGSPPPKVTGAFFTNPLPTGLQTMLNNPANAYCGLEENGLTTICFYDFDTNGNYFDFSLEHNNWIYNQVVVDISKLPRTDIGSNHFAFLDMKAYNTCLGTDGINTQCLNSQHNKLFSSGISLSSLKLTTQKETQSVIQLQNKISVNQPLTQHESTNNIHKCMRADPVYHNYVFTGRYNYVPCD